MSRSTVRRTTTFVSIAIALSLAGAACGDDDDSASALCDDVGALESSVADLEDVDVVANGVSSLDAALTAVRDDAEAVLDSAGDEFESQIDALDDSLATLESSVEDVDANGVEPVGDAVSGVDTAATELVDAVESSECD
jgi:hypothetical protein